MDWFTLFLVNAERGGNDSVPVKETKQQEGEGRAVSDDRSDDAPSTWGWDTRFSCSGFSPRKQQHIFPIIHVVSYLITWKVYFT